MTQNLKQMGGSEPPVCAFEELAKENERLRKKVALLEDQIKFFNRHPKLAAGIHGETLIAQMVNGTRQSYGSPYDMVAGKDEVQIEVKFASLNIPHHKAKTRRWVWSKILGNSNGKIYDFAILVGEVDPNWRHLYKDKNNPYILFCVPFTDITEHCVSTGRSKSISLVTNPQSKRSRGSGLFRKYQITETELLEMFPDFVLPRL